MVPNAFKPISFIGSVYKIISKILSKRIREVVGDIISSSQGAFVKKRQILDEIVIANECIEEMKVKDKKGIVCNVVLEKTYDHINWDFLDYVMGQKCFGIRWKKWINGCISLVHYTLLIKRTLRGFFRKK